MTFLKSGSCLVLCLLWHLKYTAMAPIENITEFDFEDDWDYKVQPHSVPLLTVSTKNHLLPSIYTYDEDLNVDGLQVHTNNKTDSVRFPKKIQSVVKSVVSCSTCTLGVNLLYQQVVTGATFEEIKAKFVSLCISLNFATSVVCNGFFDVFGPDIIPAFNTSKLGAKEACGLILGEICGDDAGNSLHEWDIELPPPPPPLANDLLLPESKLDVPVLKVLHLSDNHLDPDYEVGSPANCREPLCCRGYSSPPVVGRVIPAGRWGSYGKCDAPQALIDNMLKNIALEHPDIDYIIWTGDLPPHDIWNQSREGNLDIIKETVQKMFDAFPNTPIFPALGNHESIPAGSFPPPWVKNENQSISWLYNTVAEEWKRWLPATADNTVLQGGFYSVLLRPGFRLISLNMNYCHSFSWWLLVNSTDPAQELKWLVFELEQAEKSGEKVHIIGHISPGSFDCLKVWSRNFYTIVERFQNTITAQFYGHSHADEFEIFYETSKYSRPTNVAYLGPSVTPYENYNPAYRIYYIEGDHDLSTREVLDHETWTTNLEKANQGDNEPEWYKLYTAKDAYQMKSLQPEEWDKVIQRLIDDPDLFDIFYRNYYRDSPARPQCDLSCKLQIICDLKTGRSNHRHHLCHDLEYSMDL